MFAGDGIAPLATMVRPSSSPCKCEMIDWDDSRSFPPVARGVSVRAAAERLGVNHSTVLRRIAQLEERLGVLMFEKLPSGYRLTTAGEEVRELAEQMGTSANRL